MHQAALTHQATIKRQPTLPARLGAALAAGLAAALLCGGAWAQQPAEPAEPARQSTQQPPQPRAPEVDTEKEAYAKLPPCKLSDDGKHLAEEPCRTAKALDPMPRRPVPQAIERVSPAENDPRDQARPGTSSSSPATAPATSPTVPQTVTPANPLPPTPSRVDPAARASTVSPAAPAPITPSRVQPTARPGAPVPTAGCDAGGCYGPNGQRYNNGPGNTVVSPGGKLCSRNGAFIQC